MGALSSRPSPEPTMVLTALLAVVLGTGAASAQSAPPPASAGLQLSQGGWKLTVHPSVGAQWLVSVGDGARGSRGDPATTETVRLAQTAVGFDLQGPAGVFASLRGEEGLVRGDPDALEAWVGAAALGGKVGAWVGQNDLPVTRDRGRESDALALAWRPVLSERAFPLHPLGAGGGVAWPGRLSARGGVAYDDLGLDAPLAWGRLDLHPWGAPPDQQGAEVQGFSMLLGGGLARLDSAVVGRRALTTADLELRFGPAEVSGAWVGLVEGSPTGPDRALAEWIVTVGSILARLPGADLHLQLRGERLTGLSPDLRAQWVPTGRLSYRAGAGALAVYGEGRLSFEEPADGVAKGAVARDNHIAGVGMLARW